MRRVRTSLSDAQLARYVSRQMDSVFPDERSVPPDAIAAVLSAVQRAIERQEQLIALTTELKKALMQSSSPRASAPRGHAGSC